MARKRNSGIEKLVLAPWWVSAVLALLAYTILPSVLPPVVVKGNLPRTVALVLVAMSALSLLRSVKIKSLLETQTGLDSLCNLPWKRFEDVIGEAYRRQGYQVVEMLGSGADDGVDLRLRKDGHAVLVQCKRWRGKPVPVQVVRELYGVMIDQRASAAKLVATTRFTADAAAFAKDKPIELVDSNAVLRLVRDVQTTPRITTNSDEPDHLTPTCPTCSTPMVLREAHRGAHAGEKFWGCANYPKCRSTRPI